MRPSSFLIMYVPFLHFNPRTREGCDDTKNRVKDCIYILIHAPTKDATTVFDYLNATFVNFNPRTHEGCDAKIYIINIQYRIILIHAPVRGATKKVWNDQDDAEF